MASTSDIRDIMNLGQAGPRQPAPKKKKTSEPQPRVTGVRREVQALMGDSVPPIAIVEQRSYKSRPSISQKLFKPRHWDERPFQHGGRTDGLVLRHWKRSIPGSNGRAPAVTTESADVEMADDAKTAPVAQELAFEEEYPSHKWNVKVEVPSYTDEQYDRMLKSDDWTRQETDYLMELCRDYDLRWIIIADRYTPEEIPSSTPAPTSVEPNGTEVAMKQHYPPRTVESLKQRYYSIAAKMMEQVTPASTMTAAEFQLWEKMRSFDAKTETMRKAMAEKLFERTKDEADEERILLEELHRITKNEDDFIKMRRDLYARLEPVAPLRRSGNGEEQSTAMYQTSGGLSMLLQSLLAKEKRLKRPTMPDGGQGSTSATPTDARAEKGRQSSHYSRRDTLDTQATNDEPQKKSSTSQASNVRILAPADAARFGVSHPQERLTSGVQFRHEKINRLTMAKSQTQTTKIQAALTELGIPPRLLMPTERVCREFERLVGEINILLDCRKVAEKVASEVKILEEQRRIRLGLPKEGEENVPAAGVGNAGPPEVKSFPNTTDAMEVDDSQVGDESKVDESLAVDEDDQDAEAEDDEPARAGAERNEDDAQDESAIQVDAQEDGDADAEANDDASAEPVDDEDEEDQDERDEEITGLDNDEDQDEDAEDDDDDAAGGRLNADSDEDEEEEAGASPPQDTDAEEDNADDSEAEDDAEPQAETGSHNDEDEAADIDDGDSEAEAEAEAAHEVEDSEDEDQDQDDDEDPAPIPAAAAEESDLEGEDQPDGEDEPEAVPAVRAHKRSASVISEASRAGSNRSGMGRKKRR
ncbi:SWR1-complex protein 4 [Cladophialophora carrionii]|uniref:SWR1-complex protein 4 n=1 Tax=Cladophialophora carrionii TaxID=86049 RepID=A0A1C1CUL5_9EURO|nr:SWR1-complex protein 4 [Cladophialophora carrionii]